MFGLVMLLASSEGLALKSPPIAPRVPRPTMVTGLEGPAMVTAGHVVMAMNFMPLGPTAKGLGMGGKVMSTGQYNWGNRAFGNLMEHFPLFNAALWLHAVFVDAVVATQLGVIYLTLRLLCA